jgi:decaprenyl-phosphate phosphoribosyltransferase
MDNSASVGAAEPAAALPVHGGVGQPPPTGILAGLLQTARPRQWAKNVLIFAAPVAGGLLTHDDVWWRLIATFMAFCALSSGGYFVNDALDVERDRLHPRKRDRPIARGVVPRSLAFVAAVMLFVLGFALAAAMNWSVLAIAVAYVVLTVSYSVWLKHEPVVEMVWLAGAFVLRAAAGGESVGVHLSPWFTVVVSFGALFVVAGKRYAEQSAQGVSGPKTRDVLAQYPAGFLRFVWAMSATIAITGYCLWALLPGTGSVIPAPWPEISIVPFVVGVLRYGMLLEAGTAEAPEDVFLRDRTMQVMGLAWVTIYLVGLYAF